MRKSFTTVLAASGCRCRTCWRVGLYPTQTMPGAVTNASGALNAFCSGLTSLRRWQAELRPHCGPAWIESRLGRGCWTGFTGIIKEQRFPFCAQE